MACGEMPDDGADGGRPDDAAATPRPALEIAYPLDAVGGAMKNYYKLTTHDGGDLYTGGTINYRRAHERGEAVRLESTAAARLCTATVLHAGHTPRATFSGLARERTGLEHLALWEVTGVPLVDDGRKAGFRELRVLRELGLIETVYGAWEDFGARTRWIAEELIPAVRRIPWLRPRRPPEVELIEALVTEHLLALGEAGDVGPLPLRVVTTITAAAADADAAADAAYDAYDAADAAYDAADAAAAAAYADAYAADAAYADAYDAAFAAADRLPSRLPWCLRPRAVVRRAARWYVVHGDARPSPWMPLIELWSLGVLPIGVTGGEFCVYIAGDRCPQSKEII